MIKIKDVTFSYLGSAREVFTDFSLQIANGNIIGLLGKNGTGKSTLLYLICGLLHPQYGQIEVEGYETTMRRSEMLSQLFIVPEEYDLPDVSLNTYLKINRPFYPRFSRELLDQCLRDFELDSQVNLGRLSMGQKKKVYMSFAIASGTKYLFMDEPTNGLDIPSKSLFRKVIKNSMTDNRTVIISTHQAHDVEQLLGYVMILSENGLLLNSSVNDIKDCYTFGYRRSEEMDDSVLYSEPAPQGYAVVARRSDGEPQTPIDLELLFNATVKQNSL